MRHLVYSQVLSIVLLIIAQAIFVIPSDAEVNLPSITTQDYTPANVWIQFPFNGSRTVQFTTNISANNPDDIHIEVQLKLTVGRGWAANVTPEQMTFTTSSTQEALITVTVPGNITTISKVYVYLNATGQYPNITKSMVSNSKSIIFLDLNHAYEVTYKFIKKNSYTNKIEFSVTNTGNFEEDLTPESLFHASGAQPNVKFNVLSVKVSPMGLPGTIIMTAQYDGPDYPLNYPLEIIFYPTSYIQIGTPYGMRHIVSINITVSFSAPEKPQWNYIFVSAIAAFIIIMAIVMVLVIRGSTKKMK
jgi:hypothetical protein